MRIELGNASHPGLPAGARSVTRIDVPATDTADEAFRTITHQDGIWPRETTGPAPAWVECDDEAFGRRLAAYYDVPVGRPSNWEATP